MSTDDVVHLQPTFVPRLGQEAALQNALTVLAEQSREEAGCLEYTLLEDRDDPGRFSLYERWADTAAIDAHDQSPHVAAFVARFEALLAEPLIVHRLRRIA